VSQPAITRSVRSLEADLGAQLVQRTPQGILVTPGGRGFYTRVRAAYAELRRAEAEAAAGSGVGGSVSLGVGLFAGVLVLPEAVGGFRKQFPNAPVRILEGNGQQLGPLVRDGTLDFAVAPRQQVQADSALTFRPIFTHQLVVVARKGHPLRNARSLKELLAAEWVTLFHPDAEPAPIERAFAAAGLPIPAHSMQCESYRILLALLVQSNMIGMFTSRFLAKAFSGDSLEAIPIAEKLPIYSTHLVTRTGIPLSRPAALMARLILQAGRRLAKAA
jgi:DNA-binding transcriptional LysR family regulator